MIVASCQFAVTGDITVNLDCMERFIAQASKQGAQLLLFPECALSGYPPYDLKSASEANFDALTAAEERMAQLAKDFQMVLVFGTITKDSTGIHNSAVLFFPDGRKSIYHKRTLWGWDRDHFEAGTSPCVFRLNEFTIGVSICFEIRFPEFFRELYANRTDLNLVLFYDRTDKPDMDRYELIKGHIRTRAVENTAYLLTSDTIFPYQSAPTILCDRSGRILEELKQNEPGLLLYDLKKTPLDFGEQGRREISDWLTGHH